LSPFGVLPSPPETCHSFGSAKRQSWGREQTGSFGLQILKSGHSGWCGHRRDLTDCIEEVRRIGKQASTMELHSSGRLIAESGFAFSASAKCRSM